MFCPMHQTPLWFWPFYICGVYYMNTAQLSKFGSLSQNKSLVSLNSAWSIIYLFIILNGMKAG